MRCPAYNAVAKIEEDSPICGQPLAGQSLDCVMKIKQTPEYAIIRNIKLIMKKYKNAFIIAMMPHLCWTVSLGD